VQHIKDLLPVSADHKYLQYDAQYFRRAIPQLNEWGLSDATIEKHRLLLLEYLRQAKICAACTGFAHCGKEGDLQGFEQELERYGDQLTVGVRRCRPYMEDQMRRRAERWRRISGALPEDKSFQFSNFPVEQRRKYPKLLRYAEQFANTFEVGQTMSGLYIFGPPGVGKTHLVLAVVNRLYERGIPCLFVRSDSIFDKMRHILADNGDLEPMLEAYATVPVLVIDEFAQERANDFTLEKLFRIVNHRFHSKLPTWFTSNYAPPDIYRKNGVDLHDSAGPLRSRIMHMCKLAKMDGEDARQRHLQSLT
jgi:primosomal protein DnaI